VAASPGVVAQTPPTGLSATRTRAAAATSAADTNSRDVDGPERTPIRPACSASVTSDQGSRSDCGDASDAGWQK